MKPDEYFDVDDDIALLESLRDVSDYELERGKPMPSQNHSATQSNIIVALAEFKKRYRIFSELSLKLPTMRATPDICLYSQRTLDFRRDVVSLSEPPILVIEIVSPSQSADTILRKFDRYFANGVQSCWLVQPLLESITVVHPDSKPHTVDAGLVEDSVLGIAIDVAEVFE